MLWMYFLVIFQIQEDFLSAMFFSWDICLYMFFHVGIKWCRKLSSYFHLSEKSTFSPIWNCFCKQANVFLTSRVHVQVYVYFYAFWFAQMMMVFYGASSTCIYNKSGQFVNKFLSAHRRSFFYFFFLIVFLSFLISTCI